MSALEGNRSEREDYPMADISDIDAERARRLRAKWQDPQAQRHEQEFVDWGNRLRTDFGAWDSCDPAATAILALVEAQNVAHRCDQPSRQPELVAIRSEPSSARNLPAP
jgi:hypothetical protein